MAFILLRLLVLGVIAAAADDDNITWLTPPRGVVACVLAEQGRAQRRPPPPLDADDRPRVKPYRRRGEDDASKRSSMENSVEVVRKRNGTEGVYQCSVRRHGGIVLGYPQKWKFAYMQQFSRHPENGTAYAGQPYVLSCEVQSAPTASISWLKNGESLPRDDRYILVENQLLFTEVREEDAGAYKCVATNSYLNKNRISNSAWLRVDYSEDMEPSLVPLQLQTNITAPRGSRVQLLCPVKGWPRPKLTWELKAPGSRTAILESAEEVLELTSLELDQEGVYKCSVDDHEHIYKTFNVTVTEPVVITLPPLSKEVVRVSTVRFNCTATGRPDPVITWYKDGKPLTLGGRFNVQASISGDRYELVVGDVDTDDAGIYQCFAESAGGIRSSWAALSVAGSRAAAPAAPRCWPLGAKSVLLRWPALPRAMAYTVQATHTANPALSAWPGQPHINTEERITINEALVPYGFQVRAYIRGADKNLASDRSEPVYCQGQGVPVEISKVGDDTAYVSWEKFARDTPGVVQWILQYRKENTTHEYNVTLPGDVHNYTLQLTPNENYQVRVLGSKTLEWLPQNLTYVLWTSTASQDLPGEVGAWGVRLASASARTISLRWRGEAPAYRVCATRSGSSPVCTHSFNNSATLEGLEPETEYEVEVQAQFPGRPAGPYSVPLIVSTLSEGPERFKDLTCKFVNETAILVSWSSPGAKHTVSYSNELDVPVDLWRSVTTHRDNAVITDVDPSKDTYVMVTGYDPLVYSPVKTIPAQVQEGGEVQWAFSNNGIRVWRAGGGRLRYSQNLTRALDLWPQAPLTPEPLELTDLDPSLPTYVMVVAPGLNQRSHVLTIPPRPEAGSSLFLGVGIGVGVCLAVLLAIAAVCMWRKRKRAGSPLRSRRQNLSGNDEDDDEAEEMTSVGGRLANGGGSRDAGEPLLNGHVHITENPQSKAPNGKMKKGRLTFDLSRADTRAETALGAAPLDTSRPAPAPAPAPPAPAPAPAPDFAKLPDDNMNSELTRSTFPTDNSKIQPTLQPNG